MAPNGSIVATTTTADEYLPPSLAPPSSSPPAPPTWVRESNLLWYHRWVIRVLGAGPIPDHVAFIMDGNRRYAKNANISRADGHSAGFEKLSETLQWCMEIGISEITAYAFSIENFKRTQDEVDALMDLAREKFQGLLAERDKLHERGIRVRIIGNWDLLAPDMRRILAEAVLLTKDNRKVTLNVAFAYTSRDEMTHSIRTVAQGISEGRLKPEDVNEELLTRCLYTKSSAEPELLVRTSGEMRLSDFMLWQSTSSVMLFGKRWSLWPEFTIWHLFAAIFYYQRYWWRRQDIRRSLDRFTIDAAACSDEVGASEGAACVERKERIGRFLAHVEQEEEKQLRRLVRGTAMK
ncbi:dehydrodolichyl diphosphate synthase complex subunit DHDDS-like [Anopheles aquasalis]|uniref:dehydrodolichyl diphosphate synthase complex subunit DHDDS-like n=1 Tax=Anopheles aquasalis TaxID=42839 RepID=UPI00215A7600|nr:dehydrodolichyl diphosphate synthase complex subunit DHDDS-like [Anopheles aquasalis]